MSWRISSYFSSMDKAVSFIVPAYSLTWGFAPAARCAFSHGNPTTRAGRARWQSALELLELPHEHGLPAIQFAVGAEPRARLLESFDLPLNGRELARVAQ